MKLLLLQNMLYIPSIGGANKATRALLEALARQKHSCRAVAPAFGSYGIKSPDEFSRFLEKKQIPTMSASGKSTVFALQGVEVHAVNSPLELRSYTLDFIREFDPDWVFVAGEDPGQVLLQAALEGKARHIAYLIQTPWNLPFGKWSLFPNPEGARMLPKVDKIFTISNFLKEYITRWGGIEAEVAHLPVYGQTSFPDYSCFDRGFVTMVNPSAVKGISIFVALARLFPEIQFCAVPTWATTESDRLLLSEFSNVRVLEPAENIGEIFSKTRVLLVPSLWHEGFGYIVVEAMLRGIPVVASNMGGLPEAKLGVDYLLPVNPIEEYQKAFDERGCLVPIVPSQEIKPWEKALRELLASRPLYEQISRNGRNAAVEFVSECGTAPIENLLRQCDRARENPPVPPKKKDFFVAGGESATKNLSSKERAYLATYALNLRKGKATPSGETIPRLPRTGVAHTFPLSFGQQRLWFLDQLEPGNLAYINSVFIQISGAFSLSALERSLAALIERHEILRTNFIAVDGEARQIVAQGMPLEMSVIDLETEPEENREKEIAKLKAEAAQKPFDLSKRPLLRVVVARVSAEDYRILFSLHHIISDGWSMGVLIKEFATLYNAFLDGRPSPLPDLPIQYGDYAAWQRKSMPGERIKKQLVYWIGKLSRASPHLELPADCPVPISKNFSGGYHPVSIPQKEAEALKRLCHQGDATLFMGLTAVFKMLLCRYANRVDINVGTVVASRQPEELEKLVGFFLNTLVLRTDLSGNPGFREVLRRVRTTTLEALLHRDLPFEKLVEELQPERKLNQQPLFQVMFVLQNAPLESLELSGVRVKVERNEGPASKFDISFILSETQTGLEGFLNYNANLFSPAAISRVAGHFKTLLKGIVSNPEEPLWKLPMLTAGEIHQLVVDWVDAEADVPTGCIHELFEAQASRTPDSVALRYERECFSYSELNRKANRSARLLCDAGVSTETRVGIFLERSPEMIIAMLAILKAGGAYIPLDPKLPDGIVSHMLNDGNINIVLTQKKLLERIKDPTKQTLCLDGDYCCPVDARLDLNSNLPAVSTAKNLAYILYTSGSSGIPKGVMITHGSVVNHLLWRQKTFPLSPQDRFLHKASISFDISVWEIFGTLVAGAQLVIVKSGGAEDGQYLARLASEMDVTIAHFCPTQLESFLGLADEKVRRTLRLTFCGGEPMPPHLQERFLSSFSSKLYNQYGPTETTIDTTVWECKPDVRSHSIPIGRPIMNTQAYVLDAQMELVPIGVPGELYIGGAGVGRGYNNAPGLTAEKFVPDPFVALPGRRLYRTGDRCRFRVDGAIEFLGRSDNQVKIRGYRIELEDVEAALGTHPQVKECLVAMRADNSQGNYLEAYVVLRPDSAVTLSELRGYLTERLPSYTVPSRFVTLDALPRTHTGKINRNALITYDPEAVILNDTYVAPSSSTEGKLAEIWSRLLNIRRISRLDNFFDLGGHSVLSVTLVSRIRDAFHVEIPLRAVFESPVLESMAGLIREKLEADNPTESLALKSYPRDKPVAVSYAQERLLFLHEMDPGNVAQNIPVAVRLQGPLNRAALEKSLAEIVGRHEILRTTFLRVEGQPLQVISNRCEVSIHFVEKENLSKEKREMEMCRMAKKEAERPLDLVQGPLFRVTLVRYSDTEHALIISMHHIIVDGWSIGILLRELSMLYKGFTSGQPVALEPLTIQFADYVLWQRECVRMGFYQQQLEYWKNQLGDELPVLDLPKARPRPMIQSRRGAREPVRLGRELTDRLKTLGRQNNATLFMVLLAGFKTLLYRYTGQADLLVGTHAANRSRTECEKIVGPFINQLVLRTQVSGDLSFLEMLKRVRDVTLHAFANQDLPIEELAIALGQKRDLSRAGFYQVMLVLHNIPPQAMEIGNLRISIYEIERKSANLDIYMAMTEVVGGLEGYLEYSTDIFDLSNIQRFLRHFERMLGSILENPGAKVEELEYLSPEETNLITETWNEHSKTYDVGDCLHHLFERRARERSGSLAVAMGERHLTYGELNEEAEQLAGHLRLLGISAETLVGICLDRSPEMMIGLLAILKAGGAYVPLDPRYPEERLAYVIQDAGLSVILTDAVGHEVLSKIHSASLPDLPVNGEKKRSAGPQLVLIDAWKSSRGANGASLTSVRIQPDNLAYAIYTSGSSGKPKGVQITHRAMVNFLNSMRGKPGLSPADTLLAVTTLSFDIAALELFLPLIVGGKLVIAGDDQTRDGSKLAEELDRSSATVMQATPITWQMLLAAGWKGICRLKVLSGGEALPRELSKALLEQGAEVWNMYGPTETTIWSLIWKATDVQVISIGRPIANTTTYILDKLGRIVPVGVVGELCIGGHGLSRGYVNRPDLTADRFVPNPFGKLPGDRLYRTGDLARYAENGEVECLGRLDNQVKVRGFRIELGEIQAALNEHERVLDAAVTARPDQNGNRRLIAYVVGKNLRVESKEGIADTNDLTIALQDHLQKRVPEYMVPSVFVWLDSLPRTPNGKVDLRALPEPNGQTAANTASYLAPRTPMEKTLVVMWEKLLDVKKVGVRDNFFNLGGHSLLAMQLVSQVCSHFHVEITLREIFRRQFTVEELAQMILSYQLAGLDGEEGGRIFLELVAMSDDDALAAYDNGKLDQEVGERK
jgi:amino acid adenylation domain-containing protein